MSEPVDALWRRFCAAEDEYFAARVALLKSGVDVTPLIATALSDPSRRVTGLRLLEILPEAASRLHLNALVALASWAHGDMGLVRELLARIDRTWLLANLNAPVASILGAGDDEEYRRVAELYKHLSERELLAKHLRLCAGHTSPDVREIAEDFRADG